jgi:hypothetical protein
VGCTGVDGRATGQPEEHGRAPAQPRAASTAAISAAIAGLAGLRRRDAGALSGIGGMCGARMLTLGDTFAQCGPRRY